jgi:hypothetical protein
VKTIPHVQAEAIIPRKTNALPGMHVLTTVSHVLKPTGSGSAANIPVTTQLTNRITRAMIPLKEQTMSSPTVKQTMKVTVWEQFIYSTATTTDAVNPVCRQAFLIVVKRKRIG